jgi:histidine ammonia-lyase
MGAAGEITHLAHAFAPLAGLGQILAPDGTAIPVVDSTDPASPHRPAYRLGPKEGIALIQGAPGATALSALRLAAAADLTRVMEQAAALSIVAIRASRDPYHPALGRGDRVHAGVLARIRELSGAEPEPGSLQAPVSFRVAGPVFAQVVRATEALEAAVIRALTAVTDSPAFVDGQACQDGQFIGTAGFHAIDLAAHCDQLTAALCHAAEVASARIHRLMDPVVTGLNAQLARNPGPEAGLSPVHKRAAGEVHTMRRLATATATGLIETSAGQEDVQPFAWEAAEKLNEAVRRAQTVTACELLTGYGALALSGREPPPALRPLAGRLSTLVPPVTADRAFGEDIERITEGIMRRSA